MKPGQFLIPALLILSAIALVIAGCSKSNSGSKPSISIKSINTTVEAGGSLVAILNFTSNAQDLSGGTFVAIRNRLNQRPLPPTTVSQDTLTNVIPQFPDQQKGEFDFSVDWATYLHQSDQENDTIVFKFAAVDRAGNSSDTITSPKIVVKYQ
jgi:hypothetical protein